LLAAIPCVLYLYISSQRSCHHAIHTTCVSGKQIFKKHVTFFDETNILIQGFYWLAMANSMFNPFVYYWMNARFRGYFKAVISSLHMLCCDPARLLFRFVNLQFKRSLVGPSPAFFSNYFLRFFPCI